MQAQLVLLAPLHAEGGAGGQHGVRLADVPAGTNQRSVLRSADQSEQSTELSANGSSPLRVRLDPDHEAVAARGAPVAARQGHHGAEVLLITARCAQCGACYSPEGGVEGVQPHDVVQRPGVAAGGGVASLHLQPHPHLAPPPSCRQ